jgi:hypothetical protein
MSLSLDRPFSRRNVRRSKGCGLHKRCDSAARRLLDFFGHLAKRFLLLPLTSKQVESNMTANQILRAQQVRP